MFTFDLDFDSFELSTADLSGFEGNFVISFDFAVFIFVKHIKTPFSQL